MAELYKKISSMVALTSLANTDYIPIVSDGDNYKVSIAILKGVLGGGITTTTEEISYNENILSMSTLIFITETIGE